MGRGLLFDQETSRWALPAGLLSIAAHLGLFWAIAGGAQLLPPPEPLSPLRFVGQTFDVDALGEENQDEARAPGSDSAPSAAGPLEEVEVEPEIAREPEVTNDGVVPENDQEEASAPLVQEPAPPPRSADILPKDSFPEAEAKTDPIPLRPPSKPVDPFDLAVPGDSSSSAAPSAPSDTGSYGADGKDAPVTDVFKAFLHLFPEANRHNPAWQKLPEGLVGRVEFSVLIGQNTRLASIEINHNTKVPPPKILSDAIRKTQSYLSHQRLGWEGERREGLARLALTVVVQKKKPHATAPEREGTHRHGRYGEARPTGAFFTFYDGQHIDIELERIPADTRDP